MRAARLAVFHGAIIIDAQPPISAFKLWRLGLQCEQPLPAGLVELWRTSFGGALDYDFRATFGAQVACLSIRELFFPGSDHYFDLDEWIAHERKLAGGKKLAAMPFGGFESDERLFALPDGSVVAGTEGLNWPGFVTDAGMTKIAVDVPTLFRTLWLEADPETSGRETLAKLQTLETEGAHARSAAEKLKALLRSRILDWRAALELGSLKSNGILTALALESAAVHDDLPLLRRIEALGISTHTVLRGNATVYELAARSGSVNIVAALMDLHPAKNVLRYGMNLPTPLVQQLIERGAVVDASMVRSALEDGDEEKALLVLPYASSDLNVFLAVAARKRANAARSAGRPVDADRFDELADRVDPSLRLT